MRVLQTEIQERDANQAIHEAIESISLQEGKTIYSMTEAAADFFEWLYELESIPLLELGLRRAIKNSKSGRIRLSDCLID